MSFSKQLFFRLYLLIISSIVIIGWSIDYLWQSNSNLQQDSNLSSETLLLSAKLMESTPLAMHASVLNEINLAIRNKLELIPSNRIQTKQLNQLLADNQIIFLENEKNQLIAYKQLLNSDFILAMSIHPAEQSVYSKYLWLMLFYFLIAVVVYIWMRPLNRDLKTLESAATNFADAQWDGLKWNTPVEVPARSPISQLANAYNNLLFRIKQLINDQQEMSHSISHELRTPLARILFSIEMANNSQQTDYIKQQLISISEDITEIQTLIDELLNYSSLEKKSVFAHQEKGNISGLISNLIAKIHRGYTDKDISYKENGSSENVFCDSLLIERGLQNLIVNALKYCNSQVIVSFSQLDDINRIFVDDDGSGVLNADKTRIFDSFVRLEKNNPLGRKGFGLGLAIVKRIAKLHHGKTYVQDSPLGGAQFVIEWPNQVKT